MGEAKRKKLNPNAQFDTVEKRLRAAGVDTDKFGFYDQSAFVAQEQKDAAFLNEYARWVLQRPKTPEYDERVRRIVPRVVRLIADSFREDNLIAGCVAGSMMTARILDRLGIWSFGYQGSVVLEVKSQNLWRGFHTFDELDFPGAILGHSWVVAPPFMIVDPTISLQRWERDAIEPFLPDYIVTESGDKITPSVQDVVAARVREKHALLSGSLDPNLHNMLEPKLERFGKDFPALEVMAGELTARYVPVAVRISDVSLEQINSKSDRGKTGAEVWSTLIEPNFIGDIVKQ